MAQLQQLEYGAKRAMHGARNTGVLETLTRIGFAAKGTVYLFIGILALMAAFGNGGETTDKKGVVMRIASEPFGEFALVALGVGLLAYAAWRFLCAFADVEREGSDAKGMAKRIGYFCSGVFYSSAGFFAFKVLAGRNASGGNQRSLSARILEAPGGELLLAAAGIAIIGASVFMIRDGWQERFKRHLRAAPGHHWVTTAGKWGYIARGIVFSVAGAMVVVAAFNHDPSRIRGSEGALDTLAAQPFGQWLLAFVAAGLACYGAYCFIEARYRKVDL